MDMVVLISINCNSFRSGEAKLFPSALKVQGEWVGLNLNWYRLYPVRWVWYALCLLFHCDKIRHLSMSILSMADSMTSLTESEPNESSSYSSSSSSPPPPSSLTML